MTIAELIQRLGVYQDKNMEVLIDMEYTYHPVFSVERRHIGLTGSEAVVLS
jgi:hypothetical protein